MNKDRMALTSGDPAGVGPEIIHAWLRQNSQWQHFVCLLGAGRWIARLQEEFPDVEGVACDSGKGHHLPGKPTPDGARTAWAAMQAAAEGCHAGRFRAVVTGPVAKAAMQAIGFPFPGQTEFFAEAWGGKPTMAFATPSLRVVLATWHEPLLLAGNRLKNDPACLELAVERAAAWAIQEGKTQPRIAVCGLNPHAGEEGMLGTEEQEIFNPQLGRLRSRYPGLSACLPADTVFHRHQEGEFDAVVALYHDQGLIPVKTVAFHTAVNVTLGLPFVRTSPDHGTAFALAGKGLARSSSFANAVTIAWKLSEVRSRVES